MKCQRTARSSPTIAGRTASWPTKPPACCAPTASARGDSSWAFPTGEQPGFPSRTTSLPRDPAGAAMKIRQFFEPGLGKPGLGNTAHLIVSEWAGVAALIDPLRDVNQYLDVARLEGCRSAPCSRRTSTHSSAKRIDQLTPVELSGLAPLPLPVSANAHVLPAGRGAARTRYSRMTVSRKQVRRGWSRMARLPACSPRPCRSAARCVRPQCGFVH